MSAGEILGHIPPDRRIPDFGLHRVARVLVCALNGMPQLMMESRAREGKHKMTLAACKRQLQGVLNVARRVSGNPDRSGDAGREE